VDGATAGDDEEEMGLLVPQPMPRIQASRERRERLVMMKVRRPGS
jgi:hypothetical protein